MKDFGHLTIALDSGEVLDSFDVHFEDRCEDLACPADFHLEDIEMLTGKLVTARRRIKQSLTFCSGGGTFSS